MSGKTMQQNCRSIFGKRKHFGQTDTLFPLLVMCHRKLLNIILKTRVRDSSHPLKMSGFSHENMYK